MSSHNIIGTIKKHPAKRRIIMELREISEKHEVVFEDDSLIKVKIYLDGVGGTNYEGGIFEILIEIGKDYPFKPPNVRFITKIYHPNIDDSGVFCCLPLLKHNWRTENTTKDIIKEIKNLMMDPSPDKAHRRKWDIVHMYNTNLSLFNETAREWTKLYAIPENNVEES